MSTLNPVSRREVEAAIIDIVRDGPIDPHSLADRLCARTAESAVRSVTWSMIGDGQLDITDDWKIKLAAPRTIPTMKVSDLRRLIAKLPDNAPVYLHYGDTVFDVAASYRVQECREHNGKKWTSEPALIFETT